MSQNDTKQQTNRYCTNKLAVTFFSASTQEEEEEEEEEDGRSVANMNTIYLSSKVRWSSQQQGSCAGSETPSRKMGRRSSSAASSMALSSHRNSNQCWLCGYQSGTRRLYP